LVTVDHVGTGGCTDPTEDVAKVMVDHGFDEDQLAVLLGDSATPRRCSYVRASKTTTSRECDCLRATSVRSGSLRPVVKS
jgi:hypothetical protein